MWAVLGSPSFAFMTRSPARTARRCRPLLCAIVALGALSVSTSPALARTVSCGDTITANTTLHRDLTNCSGNGLVIGADNIRLDLSGHTIDGNAADEVCPVGVDFCDDGVNNAAGHRGVTIAGGTIQEFDVGVVAVNASHG